jgi:S1-C subfamily serine protease
MRSSSILLVTLASIMLSGFGLGIAPNRCLGEEKDEVKQLKEELRSLQAEMRGLREECKALRQDVLALKKRVDEGADGYIGIEVQFDKEDRSLRVTHVAKGSPAEKAGISEGVSVVAVIVEGERRNISTAQEYRQAVGNLKPGDQIEIRYLDKDAKQVKGAKITLGKRP